MASASGAAFSAGAAPGAAAFAFLPFEDLLRADVEGYLELAVSGVEMRRRMVTRRTFESVSRRTN